jgi:hypothetical protein
LKLTSQTLEPSHLVTLARPHLDNLQVLTGWHAFIEVMHRETCFRYLTEPLPQTQPLKQKTAKDSEETRDLVVAIAAPVRSYSNSIVAALGLYFAVTSCDQKTLGSLIIDVATAARSLSTELGGGQFRFHAVTKTTPLREWQLEATLFRRRLADMVVYGDRCLEFTHLTNSRAINRDHKTSENK